MTRCLEFQFLRILILVSSVALTNGFLVRPQAKAIRSLDSSSSNNEEVSSLRRRTPPPLGRATVLIPSARVLMPGSTRSLHFYDNNLLLALQHALEDHVSPGKVLALVTYDPEQRVLSTSYGVLAEVTKVEESTRTNIHGEISQSKIVTVKGLWPLKVKKIVQLEPYVVIESNEITTESGPSKQQLTTIKNILSEVVNLRSELGLGLLEASADGRKDDTEAFFPARDSYLSAMVAAQHCMPVRRAGALSLGGEELGAYVEASLVATKAALSTAKTLAEARSG